MNDTDYDRSQLESKLFNLQQRIQNGERIPKPLKPNSASKGELLKAYALFKKTKKEEYVDRMLHILLVVAFSESDVESLKKQAEHIALNFTEKQILDYAI